MAYTDVIRRLGTTRWFSWTAARLAPLDAWVLRRTGGRYGLLGDYGLPQLLLTTTGRRTGQPRTVTLLYGQLGDELVLLGSNFGQARHPAWALNLEANPHAVLEIRGSATPVTARLVVDPDERERVWAMMTDLYPGYAGYRSRAGRDIKVFALQPSSR